MLPFDPILSRLAGRGSGPYYHTVGPWFPTDDDLFFHNWIEDVLFVGYPRALFDTISLMPIVRGGITATPIHHRWRGAQAFPVDAYVITGSSGSPVFALSVGSLRGATGFTIGTRLSFLGVIGRSIAEETAEGRDYHNLGIVFNWVAIQEKSPWLLKADLKSRGARRPAPSATSGEG